MLFTDKKSNLFIADSTINPLIDPIPSLSDMKKDLNSFILSASGWRKIFAISNDEEDSTDKISVNDKYFCALIALTLAKYLNCVTDKDIENLKVSNAKNKTKILIGMDARPTGPQILDVINRVFLSLNIEVVNTFISAAPEIMALSSQDKTIDAFLYVSASHNPIGHNGIKFGREGGVYNKTESLILIDYFKKLVENEKALQFVKQIVSNLDISKLENNLNQIEINKEKSLINYRNFALLTASKGENTDIYLNNLKNKLSHKKISIVAELNGSARTLTIDKSFFKEININALCVNDKPREVVHAIVPEGENLEMCRSILEEQYKKDNSFSIGYVPDNDGDRGNLVYIKESTKKAEILQAQEVFALVVMAELSAMRHQYPNKKMAISVNGPTSMRIDDIANALDVEVFRAEVGEANVVERAKILRDQGYIVRIFGEGSNGGNITHPAKVRDPLNTILSLINLLTNKEIFDLYREKTNYKNPELSIENFINSLPLYTTTDAFSNDAKLQINSDHGILKEKYEKLFLDYYKKNKDYLKNTFNIESYKVFQMEGDNCKEGMGELFRTPPYKGGYKIVFTDSNNCNLAFIWMRGSGTEAVFRLLVDVKSNNDELYKYLLELHTKLLSEADL
ncbi:MAG: phosphoglucomutase [Pleomorphochaeta sp.]